MSSEIPKTLNPVQAWVTQKGFAELLRPSPETEFTAPSPRPKFEAAMSSLEQVTSLGSLVSNTDHLRRTLCVSLAKPILSWWGNKIQNFTGALTFEEASFTRTIELQLASGNERLVVVDPKLYNPTVYILRHNTSYEENELAFSVSNGESTKVAVFNCILGKGSMMSSRDYWRAELENTPQGLSVVRIIRYVYAPLHQGRLVKDVSIAGQTRKSPVNAFYFFTLPWSAFNLPDYV